MISTAGIFGSQRQDQRDPGDADRGRRGHRLPLGQALDEAGDLGDQALGADLEPEELGQLPDQDGQGQPVHIADHRRLGDEVGDEAEFRHGGQDHDRPGDDGEHGGQLDRPRLVALGRHQRQDRRGDHRPERGVRAQDQDARRAEDGVAEQAQDGRVQPGDRRQARQFRVGHALRDQQRGEHHPGDNVPGEPLALVGRDHLEPGHRTEGGHRLPGWRHVRGQGP
jgi:hypothetical protein